MRTLVEQGRVEIRVWDGNGVVPMEPEVFNQMRNIATLPVVVGAALMADGHVGVGGPVGAVVVTRAAIIPSVTGVDLGCGVNGSPDRHRRWSPGGSLRVREYPR